MSIFAGATLTLGEQKAWQWNRATTAGDSGHTAPDITACEDVYFLTLFYVSSHQSHQRA